MTLSGSGDHRAGAVRRTAREAPLDTLHRIELRLLRAFLVVAEEMHFRRAAERLHVTQPTLSRMIKRLETQIGVALFVRSTRSVQLSPAGEVLQAEARDALRALERGVRLACSAADGAVGALHIAYMDFAINGRLPEILQRYRRLHPDVRVELSYMPTSHQKEAILSGDIDIGFLIGPFDSEYVECERVGRDTLVVLLPDKHPLTRKRLIHLNDLAEQPFILGSEAGWSTFRRIVFELCHKAGFSPTVAQEASTSDGIFGLVAANVGVTLYASCVRNILRKGLTTRPLVGGSFEIETLAAWRRDTAPPTAWKFIEVLRHARPA